MPFIIFLVAIVLSAGWRLSTRYEYSRKARVVLSWTAAGALALSLVFNLFRFPGLNLLYLSFGVIGVFLPIYAVGSLLIVELWRKRLQALYDSSVKALRADEEKALDRITQLQQQIALAEHKRQTLEEVHREHLADQRRIREFLDGWERGEGLARIRSIKVQEWREGFAALAAAEREARRVELCDQLAAIEPKISGDHTIKDRSDQLRAQLSVLSLLQLGAFLDQPNAELAELERKTDEAKAERTDRERSLESLRYELADWERRRNEFLADRIVLGN
jgi:hypothetical protein